MADKYEFASSEWVGYASEWVENALADADLEGVDVEFCEEFTDPPAHLAGETGTAGWHMIIKDGEVNVGYGVIDAKTKIVADYQTILPLALMITDPTDEKLVAEMTKIITTAIAEGKFTPPSNMDTPGTSVPQLAGLHNALAVRTRSE
jgi:hypothetical protein